MKILKKKLDNSVECTLESEEFFAYEIARLGLSLEQKSISKSASTNYSKIISS